MFFRPKLPLSRCQWRTHCDLSVVQPYPLATLSGWRLDLQWLKSFVEEQSRNEEKSRSDKLKLFYRVPLKTFLVAERVEAGTAGYSIQMAEEVLKQRTHCVLQGHRVLLRSLTPFGFCLHSMSQPIK